MKKVLGPIVVSARCMSHVKTRFTHTPYWQYEQLRKPTEEHLTQENQQFLDEVVADRLALQRSKQTSSPLQNEPWPLGEWKEGSRRTGVIAQKIGVQMLYTKEGKAFLTTLLHVNDNHVINYVSPEEYAETEQGQKYFRKQARRNWIGKFGCLVVGAESTDPRMFTKDYCGLFEKAGVVPKKKLSRFIITPNAALQPGFSLTASHFRAGEFVDVWGKTIDYGFQGVMKRHGFKGMPKSHGVTKTHRRGGNIGYGGEKGRVFPGTKMPGHMGSERRVMKGLKIWRINHEHNVLYVHGNGVPGPTNSWVLIYDSLLPQHVPETPNPFPTIREDELLDLPPESFAADLHPYSDPTITYSTSESE